jgi:hypothetical protein
MALPSSGIITMQDLQDEYGGGHPIDIVEYYRNGSYVPSTIYTNYNFAYDVYSASNQTYWYTDSTSETSGIYIGGTLVRSGASYSSTSWTSNIGGGTRTYTRASYKGSFNQFNYYSYNRYDTLIESVNQNVPTSGTISLSDFYGGRKT